MKRATCLLFSFLLAACVANVESQEEISSAAVRGSWPLVIAHSGLCLDVYGASVSRGTPIVQWPCNWGENQFWAMYTAASDSRYKFLVAGHSGRCLDVPGASRAAGEALWQWDCNQTDAQLFEVVDRGNFTFALRNKASGLCLDVSNASRAPGARVIQWPCHYGPNQVFRNL